jgi:hypothetical protein
MSFESNLITYLAGQSGITALIGIGTSPETIRCYPLVLPQDPSYPALVYQLTANTERSLAGPTGRINVQLVIDALAASHSGARSLADAVRGVLDGLSGTFGSLTVDGAHHISEADAYEDSVDIFRVSQQYFISYNV